MKTPEESLREINRIAAEASLEVLKDILRRIEGTSPFNEFNLSLLDCDAVANAKADFMIDRVTNARDLGQQIQESGNTEGSILDLVFLDAYRTLPPEDLEEAISSQHDYDQSAEVADNIVVVAERLFYLEKWYSITFVAKGGKS